MPRADHDAVLLDLDGVVYTDDVAVTGAPEALARLRRDGTAVRFVTNNASRTPQQVADRLVRVGVAATAEEVLGSPQATAELLAGPLGVLAGARVAVAGGPGLLDAMTGAGYRAEPVTSVQERPDVLVQGFSADIAWADLAAATYWVREGVTWVATNLDLTIPTARGIAPGNGLLVRTVAEAAGREPDAVAGKPEPHLFTTAARSCDSSSPLVVGDRLDTDIAGGRAAGYATALVLTGVHGTADALGAAPGSRPDMLLGTLADLWDGAGADAAEKSTLLLHEAWSVLDALPPEAGDERRHALEHWRARLSPAAP